MCAPPHHHLGRRTGFLLHTSQVAGALWREAGFAMDGASHVLREAVLLRLSAWEFYDCAALDYLSGTLLLVVPNVQLVGS